MGDLALLKPRDPDSEFARAYKKSLPLDDAAKKYLAERAITPKLASAHGLRTAKDWGMGRAILVPLGTINGIDETTGVARNLDWHDAHKFTNPYGEGNSLFFTAGHDWSAIVKNAKEPVAIIEGPLKAIAASHHVPALGITGIYNWRTKIGDATEPLPEFAMFKWEGRVVHVVPDSDAADPRKNVGLAVVQLGSFLQRQGADVRIVQIPSERGKNLGADDFIEQKGAKEFRKLLDAALSLDDKTFHRWGVPQHKFQYTDNSAAEGFVIDHGLDVRYTHEFGIWRLWRGERWVLDTDNGRQELMLSTARRLQHEAMKITEPKQRSASISGACALENAQRIPRVLSCVTTKTPISTTAGQWDRHPMLFSTATDVIDLRTGRTQRNERELLLSQHSPVAFDPKAECPRWERFLAEVFRDKPELVPYIARVVGYFMTGDTREQCFFTLWGTGNNGKGVFVHTLERLFGDYVISAEPETIMLSRHGGVAGRARSDIVRLSGRRLVTTTELEDGCVLSESLVKRFTGQDTITARTLYKSEIEYRPQFKLLISTNAKPAIRGTDHAIWRRVRLIPFTRCFDAKSSNPEDRPDPTLEDTLRAELPGILNWAMRGCADWQKNRLREPKAVKAATEAYRTEQDVLGAWFEECCIKEEGARTKTIALHNSYVDWCERTKWRTPLHDNVFGAKIKERWGIDKTRNRDGYWYTDIYLKSHGDGVERAKSVTQRRKKHDAD